MVESVILKNNVTGESMSISSTDLDADYILESLEFKPISIKRETYKIPGQLGYTLSSSDVESRPGTLTGYIVSKATKEELVGKNLRERLQIHKENLEAQKKNFNLFFSLKDKYTISIGEYKIDFELEETVNFTSSEQTNNEVMCRFQISFICDSPLFYIEKKIENKWKFTGWQQANIIINNSGQFATGMEIEITPEENVPDMKITNLTTGEFIYPILSYKKGTGSYGTILPKTATAKINTNDGEQNFMVGNYTYMRRMSFDSTFFKLQRGDNEIKFAFNDVQNPSLHWCTVVIKYKELYINIEEQ